MPSFLKDWPLGTWDLVLDAAPWLLAGFLLAGAVHALVPVDRIAHHLGRKGWAGVLKASLIGVPLPLCSCSVIPVAVSMRKKGATRGAFVSFLISTPETGVDSIAISYALLGPVLAVIRPVAALLTALTAGTLVDRFDSSAGVSDDRNDGRATGRKACSDASGCAGDGAVGAGGGKLTTALRHGLCDMYADLAPYLIAGFLLAGLVTAVVPEGFFDRTFGTGLTPMLLMLVVGLPLYVCATSSTPVAAALIAGGLSPGAALVFLLVGPATNIATMLIVLRDVGGRGLALYLGSIIVVALGLGFATNLAASSWTVVASAAASGHGCPAYLAWPAGIVLALLTLNGLRLRLGRGGSVDDQP